MYDPLKMYFWFLPETNSLTTVASNSKYWYRAITNKQSHAKYGNKPKGKIIKQLKIGHVNARGSLKGNKWDEFGFLVDKHNTDVLGVSEINYDARDSLPLSKINYNFEPGFTYSNQKTRVGVFIKRGLVYRVRTDIMSKLKLPCVWIDMKVNNEKVAIVNIYREFKKYKTDDSLESESLPEQKIRFKHFIEVWVRRIKDYSEMFVLGDFNFDFGVPRNKPFIDIIKERIFSKGFVQIINKPTFANSRGDISLIDHIYTNADRIRDVVIDRCMDTDHALISVTKECEIPLCEPQYRQVRSMKYYTKGDLVYTLLGMDLDIIHHEADPERQVAMLTAALNVATDVICPEKIIKDKKLHTHWMTDQLRMYIKQRDYAFSEYIKFKNHDSLVLADYSRRRFIEYKMLRNKVIREVPKAKKTYYAEKMDDIKNSKYSWYNLNEASGRNPRYQDPITIVENDVEITNPKVLADKFNEFYKDKVDKIKESITATPPHPEARGANNAFEFDTVTYRDVIKHINTLTNSGAEGTDKISNRIVKDAKWVIAPILAKIINNCFRTGKFPEAWKIGKINVTYKKKGPKTEMMNYRPVTVLCSLSKIIEKVMFKQLTSFLNSYQLFDPSQYGFREGHSTAHAVLDYVHTVLSAKEDPHIKVNSIFIDLSAAFDLVEHETTLHKLRLLGVGDRAIGLLRNYLCNRQVFTEIGMSRSALSQVKHGVPQGSILGPLLYIIYIFNIKNLDNNRRIIYADDTSTVVVANTYEGLKNKTNQAMDNLIKYYAGTGLKMNPNKTELVSHSKRDTKVDLGNGTEMDSTESARMLGLQVDRELNFHVHISMLEKKIRTRMVIFRRIARVAGLKARMMFGYGIMLSCIHYAISAWASTDNRALRSIRVLYDRCVRAMAGPEYKDWRSEDLRKELLVLSFQETRQFYDITTLNRIIKYEVPLRLRNAIQTDFTRETRTTLEGHVRPVEIPRTERMRRSFIHRACREYNNIPSDLRKLGDVNHRKFKKCVKLWLLGIPYDTGLEEGWGDNGGDCVIS